MELRGVGPGERGGTAIEPLPPHTVAAVRLELQTLVARIVDAVGAESTVYGNVLRSPEGIGIRLGIEQALRSFLDAVERGERPARETAEVWRRIGESEFQAGRGLDQLRAAFRTGARAAWRGAADIAAQAGVPAQTVIGLAEEIFIFSDDLGAEVVEGYLRMQSDQASERERRRRRLATLLLDSDGHDPEAIEHAAELARWPVPRSLALLAIAGEDPGAITRRLDVDALVGADAQGAWLVVPDPEGPGRRVLLERAAAGTLSALGPAVPPGEATRSLRWARLALSLAAQGTIADGARPIRVEERLSELILLQDQALARRVVSRRLGSLELLPTPERERLLETLEAWLAHQRHTPGIAEELHVHPQTVRYRIAKLRELLEGVLDSPDGRFELELALRVRRALGA